jgi:dihydropteroate synthase
MIPMETDRKCFIWGILNVTPDSFSDGDPDGTVEKYAHQAKHMEEAGADFIDIGGESTRPGHRSISADEELQRVLPVIGQLKTSISIPLAIDTQKAKVAERALQLGVATLNDIWGLQGDPNMAAVAAQYDAQVVAMHNGNYDPHRSDVVGDVMRFWEKSLAIASVHGVSPKKIFLDPGIGFGKDYRQNLEILSAMERLVRTFDPIPIYLGVSRKSFLGKMTNESNPVRRDGASVGVAAMAQQCGIMHFRVHNVALHHSMLSGNFTEMARHGE